MKGKITSIDLTLSVREFNDIFMSLIEGVEKRVKEISNYGEEDKAVAYLEIMSYHKLIKNMCDIIPDENHFYESDEDVEKLKKEEDYYMGLAKKYDYA